MRTKPVTPMLAPEKGAVWSKFTKNKEPNVSTHNRHQLSHQLSVVIASTLYPAPDTIVSLYTESPNRIGGDIVLLDLRTTKSSTWSSMMSLFPVSTTSVTGS